MALADIIWLNRQLNAFRRIYVMLTQLTILGFHHGICKFNMLSMTNKRAQQGDQ